MKKYKFKFTQEEINAIWIVAHFVGGKGKYKECFDGFIVKLKPYVSDYLKKDDVDLTRYCSGKIVFKG